MDRRIIGLTAAAALFCSPFAFADTDTSTTSTGDGTTMPSTAPASTTSTTTTSTTTTDMKQVTIQLKTADGRMINANIQSQDVQGLKEGDTLTVGTLTPTTP